MEAGSRRINKKLQEFSELILKIVKTVHKDLGPGFTESVYQGAMAIELRRYKVNYLKEMSFEIFYQCYKTIQGIFKRCNFCQL